MNAKKLFIFTLADDVVYCRIPKDFSFSLFNNT
jgi:hypothetical protein